MLSKEEFPFKIHKCLITQDHIEYLWHVTSSKRIAPDLTKDKATVYRPIPINLTIMWVPGLTGY